MMLDGQQRKLWVALHAECAKIISISSQTFEVFYKFLDLPYPKQASGKCINEGTYFTPVMR